MERLFDIIHEDAELLVINKPAGLVCHPTKGDMYSSLISRVRLHLDRNAPNRPQLSSPSPLNGERAGVRGVKVPLGQPPCPETAPAHLVNRLDRETSGLVLVAKTDDTAKQLRRIWENRSVRKLYWAIVHGHVMAETGTIDAPLEKDTASIIAIKDRVGTEGAPSQTEFAVERRFVRPEGKFTWLRVMPQTGRKHQIRIHLAHLGHPIVGDKLYGGDEDLYLALVEDRLTAEQRQKLILPHHALHAREVRFEWRSREIVFSAEPENLFMEFIK